MTHLSKRVKVVIVNEYKTIQENAEREGGDPKNSVLNSNHVSTQEGAASVHIQHLCNEPDMLHIQLFQKNTAKS